MVGTRGVEPRTSSLSVTRSNQLSYVPEIFGATRRARTDDLLFTKQLLYQLS